MLNLEDGFWISYKTNHANRTLTYQLGDMVDEFNFNLEFKLTNICLL